MTWRAPEGGPLTKGAAINESIRQAGCVALVDLESTRLMFYPRGMLPQYIHAYLDADGDRRRALAIYLTNLGRGLA